MYWLLIYLIFLRRLLPRFLLGLYSCFPWRHRRSRRSCFIGVAPDGAQGLQRLGARFAAAPSVGSAAQPRREWHRNAGGRSRVWRRRRRQRRVALCRSPRSPGSPQGEKQLEVLFRRQGLRRRCRSRDLSQAASVTFVQCYVGATTPLCSVRYVSTGMFPVWEAIVRSGSGDVSLRIR